jgi:hypothetical protein
MVLMRLPPSLPKNIPAAKMGARTGTLAGFSLSKMADIRRKEVTTW